MKNFRGFQAVYIPQSNTRGAYVKLVDLRRRETVKVSLFNTSFDDASDIANEYLEKLGIKVIGRLENNGKGYILFTENFETSIKK